MKTPKELAGEMRKSLGNWLRADPILTSGETLLETNIKAIQDEAFKAGLCRAASVVCDWNAKQDIHNELAQTR